MATEKKHIGVMKNEGKPFVSIITYNNNVI